MRIRSRLLEEQRSKDELRSVNTLAAGLTAIRPTPDLLRELVQQVRSLLAVDVAYFCLLEGDTLYTPAAAGAIGDELTSRPAPAGHGIAGRIFENRHPFSTLDYLADTRISHTSVSDRQILSENIVSVLGVPLIFGNDLLGVLFAAHRSSRHFQKAEIELLTSVATHASIAVHNARLYEAGERTAKELASAHSQALEAAERDRRIAEFHACLASIALGGGTVSELAEALAAALDAHVVIQDPGERSPGPDPAPNPKILLRDLAAGAETMGRLIARKDAGFSSQDVRLLEEGLTVLSLLLLSDAAVARAESAAKTDFVHALLSPDVNDPQSTERMARRLGLDLTRPISAGFAMKPESGRAGQDDAARVAAALGGISVEYLGGWLLLFTESNTEKAIARAKALLGPGSPTKLALAPPVTGRTELVRSVHNARRAARILAVSRTEPAVEDCRRLMIYSFLFDSAAKSEFHHYVSTVLGPLLERDSDHGSDLAGTLLTFFQSGQSNAATAEKLHIHPNTLYRRMDRIDTLLGPGWRSADRLIELAIALHVRNLDRAVSGS
ncbi:GAF domain-containing protein [Arthrobacter sp. NPDC080031]|uniref:helix-turn-helix domain-containing protein n=1 Tax=Arthrobacter sp. NPDC080031 TaxID=3155918 RepID=UPI00344DB28A